MSVSDEYENYIPKPIPKGEGYTESDIVNIFKKITRRYGMSNIRIPVITYDERFPILFGITFKWKIFLNMYHLPKVIPKSERLWWIEYGPLHHELGHYHVSPYDVKTIMEYLYIIQEEWPEVTKDQAFYVLNLFTDIIVNFFLSDRYPNDSPKAIQYWFKYNDDQVNAHNLSHSKSWRIFVKIHELKWWVKIQKRIPKKEEEFSAKIYGMLNAGEDRKTVLRYFVRHGKKFFESDLNKPAIQMPSIKQVQSSGDGDYYFIVYNNSQNASEKSQSQTSKGSEGNPSDYNNNGNEDGSKNDGDSNVTDGSGSIFTAIKNISAKQNTQIVSKKRDDVKYQNVLYNGKSTPYDILISGGDPFEEKFPSKISDLPFSQEQEQAINHLIKISKGRGASALKLMVKIGMAPSEFEAKRMWIRSHARNLLRYESEEYKETAEIQDGMTRWRWSDPMRDLSLIKSIMVNPVFIYPPNARKINYIKGHIGKRIRDYSDCLIVIDSSTSMGSLSNGNELSTPFDFAVLSSFAVLHAASRKNVNIAAVNFSSTSRVMDWFKVSENSLEKIERFLMRPIGGGTIFPILKIKELLSKRKKVIMIVITDAELSNFEKSIELFSEIKDKHKVLMFFIDPIGTEDVIRIGRDEKKLTDAGVKVFRITSYRDLPSIVIKNTSKFW